MAADYTEDGARLLAEIQPESFLCIGYGCGDLISSKAAPSQSKQLDPHDAVEGLKRLGSFDFAFVADALEQLTKPDGFHLLAALRDLHGGRFAVAVKLGIAAGNRHTSWEERDLIGMGLTRAPNTTARDGDYGLFIFDIRHYKQTPDWLNPRFWAHPERWDKERW